MIVPPSLGELEKRLRGRNSENPEQLALRIAGAEKELAEYRVYDYVVVNDDAMRASEELISLIKTFSSRVPLIAEGSEPWLNH
jgi:guanylate kinase